MALKIINCDNHISWGGTCENLAEHHYCASCSERYSDDMDKLEAENALLRKELAIISKLLINPVTTEDYMMARKILRQALKGLKGGGDG